MTQMADEAVAEERHEEDVGSEDRTAQGSHVAQKIADEDRHGDAEEICDQPTGEIGAERNIRERE